MVEADNCRGSGKWWNRITTPPPPLGWECGESGSPPGGLEESRVVMGRPGWGGIRE